MAALTDGSVHDVTGSSPPSQHERTHFVVATMGTSGGVYPFLACAESLKRRGHSVTFLGPEAYDGTATRSGLSFRPILSREEYAELIGDPNLWNPTKSLRVVWRSFRKTMSRITEFFATLPKDQRCTMVSHPLLLTAASLVRAERPSLRIAAAYFSPFLIRTVHDPMLIGPLRIPRWVPKGARRWLWHRVDSWMIDPVALPDYNAARKTHGLPPVPASFVEYLHGVPDLTVTLFPSWFAGKQPDWPRPTHMGHFQLYDPNPNQSPSPELDRFLSAGEPPVVFTPGTGYRFASAYFDCALQAVRQLGCRAIFLTMHREQVPRDLPETVLWQEYMPFRSLLPRVPVLVHHGGIGTTAEALRAGVPQIVVATAHDQFDNGARVESLGVGRRFLATRLHPKPLANALRELLASDAIRARCRAVASNFEKDCGEEAFLDAIEKA